MRMVTSNGIAIAAPRDCLNLDAPEFFVQATASSQIQASECTRGGQENGLKMPVGEGASNQKQ